MIKEIINILDILIMLVSGAAAITMTLALSRRPADETASDVGMMLLYLAFVLAINALLLIFAVTFIE